MATDLLTLLDTLELDKVGLVGHDWGGRTGVLTCLRTPECFRAFALGIGHPVQRATLAMAAQIVAWRLSARSERTSGVSGDVANVATAILAATPPSPDLRLYGSILQQPDRASAASRCTAPSCFGKSETRPLPTAASARAHPSPRRSRRSHRQSALLQGWEDNADTMTVERLNVSDTSFRRKHRTRS